ncbi:MAG TPA: four helix bundle protein [Vicinamibacteria bacterium]|nr:four helix bundle protein [Vicinamibacteria bacterium]
MSATDPDRVRPTAASPLLDPERLDVYGIALKFQLLTAAAVPRGHRTLRDQLERASLSILLNIAEGAGRRSRHDKARFYCMARGSCAECFAIFDVLRLRAMVSDGIYFEARRKLTRIAQMLTRLERTMRS